MLGLMGVAVGATATAQAYEVTVRKGSTGYTEVPATYGYHSWGDGGQTWMPHREVCTTRAYNGSQIVQATYGNWKWVNDDWTPYGWHPYNYSWKTTLTERYRMGAGTCHNFKGALWQVVWTPADGIGGTDGGYFSSDITFRWYKRSTEVLIGKKVIDYTGYDFRCETNLPDACVTGEGWVWLRGYEP